MRSTIVGISLLGLVGCADKTPARITFSITPLITSGSSEVPLTATVANKSGDVLPDRPTYAVTPSDAAVITQSGGFRCIKSADVKVVATAGVATAEAMTKCRIVDAVVAPASLRLIIPNEPVAPKVAVLDGNKKPFTDVPLAMAVADTGVARVDGEKFRPIAVGTTKATVSAGEKSSDIALEVVRKVKSEPLLINDGARYNLTLEQGNYEVEVNVRSGGTSYGVTLVWVGGDNCENKSEAQEITARCHIENTGSLIIENPSLLGLGPAADGYLNVYEVP